MSFSRPNDGHFAVIFFSLWLGATMAGDPLLGWSAFGFGLFFFICWLFDPEWKEINEDHYE